MKDKEYFQTINSAKGQVEKWIDKMLKAEITKHELIELIFKMFDSINDDTFWEEMITGGKWVK